RNLRLGISADGVDVNTGNMHHSVWPVLIVIYNLPPWLCMKRKFINLSVLISGYPGNDIDVFLEPLVDDLHTLFETGVDTYDASTKDNFNLCAVVLWTINDYPALGTLCGCPYNGFKGCVVCGKDTNCVRISALSKQSYHPFRKQKKAFNGQQEFLQALILMTGEQIDNEGCIAEETIAEETIEFFSEYHKSMETIGIPPDKHETYENEEGKPLSAGKLSMDKSKITRKQSKASRHGHENQKSTKPRPKKAKPQPKP
ncbi:putative transposase-associated domain-containing protein, partial [Tanacetum coccineum]